MRPKDIERERASFALLRNLAATDSVLIGGYAVSAYGPPRFSVDLDIVVPTLEGPRIREILRKAGFVLDKTWEGGDVFAGKSERWVIPGGSFPTSVDLLIDGVSDRVSGASQSYAELRSRSSRKTVRGFDGSSVAEAHIPDREAMIGLKLQAGRYSDLRDIAVLAGETFEIGKLADFLAGVRRGVLVKHLYALESAIDTQEFRNSLKGVYMLDERTFERYRNGAKKLILGLRRALSLDVSNDHV